MRLYQPEVAEGPPHDKTGSRGVDRETESWATQMDGHCPPICELGTETPLAADAQRTAARCSLTLLRSHSDVLNAPATIRVAPQAKGGHAGKWGGGTVTLQHLRRVLKLRGH